MRYINKVALLAPASVTKNGDAFDSNQWVSCSFHTYFANNSVEGTVKLQVSNDTGAEGSGYATAIDGFAPTNWVDLPNQSALISAGTPAILTVTNMTYRWIRAVWTRTAGDAVATTVNVNALST